ncbi:MAG: GNAT family protein [Thermoplasmatota archaeon]|nr:GNAT family N-acetyltransferase [Candidatus Thermoplasmatota archaeon]MBU1913748.1 GNAT family N-acetyltransferase [Candidatus Thermoplasmatota archaeon]
MIRGTKINLVAVSEKYLKEYVRWINDPAATDMLGVLLFPMSTEQERKWVDGAIAEKDFEKPFTILTKDGKPLGNCGFNRIDYVNRYAVLGILIGEVDFWDKGYGTDAIRTLLRFAFQELGMHKVCLNVDSVNDRAIACYKKCGFVQEGRFREHQFHHGKYVDSLSMAVLAEDWLRENGKPRRDKKGPKK